MLKRIYDWIRLTLITALTAALVQLTLKGASVMGWVELLQYTIMAFCLIDTILGALRIWGGISFSASGLVTFLWFFFISFIQVYPLFLGGSVTGGREFLIVISSLSLLVLVAYAYSILERMFKFKKFIQIKPYTIIALSFAFIIFLGSVLLFLPISQPTGKPPLAMIDALFMSTSAVCVTGLAVVDPGTQLSRFGQTVIMLLVQLGGLGIMTFAAFFSIITGEKMSLHGQTTTQNAVSSSSLSSLSRFVTMIIISTVAIELIGSALFFIRFSQMMPLRPAVFYSLFHGVNAFCNAGFGLYSDSFIRFRGDILINITLIVLIILGGLGFMVLQNTGRVILRRDRSLNLHSKIVLTASAILIILGAAVFFLLEKDNLLKGLPLKDSVMASIFASVTPRTAGFNTLDYGLAKDATLIFTCILMFIGASPGSTGGGIKTTTFVVIVLNTINIIRDRLVVNAFGREIPFDIIRKSLVVFFLSLVWVITGSLLLSLMEPGNPLSRLIFEQISAFGTVGLSAGVTPTLSVPGKILIILTMFFGRVGPITLVFSLGIETSRILIRHPEEKIITG